MLKNNTGITMISLVITLVVLIILASITANSGISTTKQSRYYNAVSQMKVMQSNVNEWYEYYKNSEESGWDKGKNISGSTKETQAIKAYNSASKNNKKGTDIGSITGYKYFDVNCIKEELDIEGINYDFIINIETRTVILVDGVKLDDVTYYSLVEIEDEQYNVEYNGN